MTKDQFIQKVAQELGVFSERLTPSTSLASISAWDSMGKMAILVLIDSELQLELPQGSLQKCHTVSDLVGLVEEKLSNE